FGAKRHPYPHPKLSTAAPTLTDDHHQRRPSPVPKRNLDEAAVLAKEMQALIVFETRSQEGHAMILDFHTHPPSHYLKIMYLESTFYGPPATRCAFETVGADHFTFGTDAPPLKPLKKAGVEIIKSLKLAPEDEAKVFADNAKRLLKI